ncbi:MAG: hypothetical protein Ct9H300mP23_09510 [Nitrospinota bacterium]|nr:MAG: hypothetical protein Ct9H300mP23_09510 [Nitrospinota bacterium]
MSSYLQIILSTDTPNHWAPGNVYLSSDVERILSGYHWQGNIRELENVIKRAVMLCLSGPILPEHLPSHLQKEDNFSNQWDDRLNQLIKDFLLNNNLKEEGLLYAPLIQKVEKHLFEIFSEPTPENKSLPLRLWASIATR